MSRSFFYCGKIVLYIILPLLLFAMQKASAQKNVQNHEDSLFNRFADTAVHGYNKERPYYIAAWERTTVFPVQIVRKLGERIAIIAVDNDAAFDLCAKQMHVVAARNDWKFSPVTESKIGKNETKVSRFIVAAQDLDQLLTVLKAVGGKLTILSTDKLSNSVVIQCKAGLVMDYLLSQKEVIFIDVATTAFAETGVIGYNRSFDGINAVDYSIPGANGKNIVAGVKEQKMEENDLDLWKRVLPSAIAANHVTSHATVIASLLGGSGNSFYDGRGIAWGCKFFPSSFDNLFADDPSLLASNKVTVQNHSYGTVIQQFYGAEAVSYDALAWQRKEFIPVFSAGNQGTAAATEGRYANLPGYANLTGNFKMAKNVISVGAVNPDGTIPPESSSGPVYDGRLAPQIMALGPGGTSDAAAIVSGTIAVMQQVYADSNSQVLPAASLVKAILYNSAKDIYHTGIDHKTGYGLLDSYGAIRAIQQKKYDGGSVSQGAVWTKNLVVPANTAMLKVTLAWTDTTGSVNNDKALVNDLDLELEETGSGSIYKPWVLNVSAVADSLSKLPSRQRDSLNTAEQVSIWLPVAGTYQIKVAGRSVSTGILPFHIAYNQDTLNSFTFTSPQHASDINIEENQILRVSWKTFVADTNQTGDLFISYDLGANWQLLQRSIKLTEGEYNWLVKDTSSTATLKMETGFGSFLSKDFIISRITRPVVDFVCADSFRLSWNRHVYASGYRVYSLSDDPYLQPVLTVNDTFVVLQRTTFPSRVYAVEPVLNNGLPAARSIAQDIELQGVHCFYKTLNYNLLDYNRVVLLLELSVQGYADSVFFERVSGAGQLLQTYGSIAVTTELVYRLQVNELAAGVTYFRAGIKLRNGATVYTDIIPLLITGKRAILFYPNPARRTAQLNFVLQQGIPAGSRLQVFDLSGRLLRTYSPLSGQINIGPFAPAVLIYKLLDTGNKILETGKLVIQ